MSRDKNSNWERSTELKLTSGKVIRVRAVPPLLILRAMERVEIPTPPVIEVKSELPGGGSQLFEQPDDPEYKRRLQQAQADRADIITELHWLYGLPDIHPPEDDEWKRDLEEILPDIKWREGARGKRLDYLEYVFLSNNEDIRRLREAVNELSSTEVDVSVMRAAEESFRGDLQRTPSEGEADIQG